MTPNASEAAAAGTGPLAGRDEGRVAFRLRIGVTGHRNVQPTDELLDAVDAAIDMAIESVAIRAVVDVIPTVVSSLAGGADQIVARRVLTRRSATLEVVLPFDHGEYRATLDEEAATIFDSLLARASSVHAMPEPHRPDDGYLLAGQAVVDRCDVLIAVWDGEPARGRGGTAEVAAYARDRKGETGNELCAVIVVDPSLAAPVPHADPELDTLLTGTIDDCNAFNEGDLDRITLASIDRGADLLPACDSDRSDTERQLAAWIAPFYARADALAMRAQQRYTLIGIGVVGASATALVCAAIGAILAPEPAWPAWVEIASLTTLILLVALGRRAHFHARWISNRFLAERFRSAVYLALAGLSDRSPGSLDEADDDQHDWAHRAYELVWAARPAVELPLRRIQQIVVDGWLDPQIRYHERTAARQAQRHRRSIATIWTLLVSALVVALGHLVVQHEEHENGHVSASQLLSLASIVLPALGGAVTAILSQREYERHHHRNERVARDLVRLRDRIAVAAHPTELAAMVLRAEETMISETRDWLGSVQFHDLEPHV